MRPPRPGSGGALSQIGSRWGGSGTGVAGTCLFPGALSQRPGETALDPHPSALAPFLRAAESWGCLGRRWVRDAPLALPGCWPYCQAAGPWVPHRESSQGQNRPSWLYEAPERDLVNSAIVLTEVFFPLFLI